MLSKTLTGSFMLVGPLLAIVSMFLFSPGGDDQTFAQELQAMSENYAMASIAMVLFFVELSSFKISFPKNPVEPANRFIFFNY